MIRLRLFAFDDETIEPFHKPLMKIHQLGGPITILEPGQTADAPLPGCEIVVECTYAAPGRMSVSAEGSPPKAIGGRGVLNRVLEYTKKCLEQGGYDIILLDNTLSHPREEKPDYGVCELLPIARKGSPDASIAIITGHPMIPSGRAEELRTAFEGDNWPDMWLSKMSSLLCDTLCSMVFMAAKKRRLLEEMQRLREQLKNDFHPLNMVGDSPVMRDLYRTIGRILKNENAFGVLISGESGVGKELVASAIHYNDIKRANKPFVAVHCGALPENLIESELFGHEQGAFTGAGKKRKGRFEMANHGTIFLDEIDTLPIQLQAKLLRVLQENQFEPLGSSKTISVDVRVIAATNKNLYEMVTEGNFREDLYYRLNVIPIEVPPLRERSTDIPLLVYRFIHKYNNAQEEIRISSAAIEKLSSYHWPGNVRELENAIIYALVHRDGEEIMECHLPGVVRTLTGMVSPKPNLEHPDGDVIDNYPDDEARGDAIKYLIKYERICRKEYRDARKIDRPMIARALKINRQAIYYILGKYGKAMLSSLKREPQAYPVLLEKTDIIKWCSE